MEIGKDFTITALRLCQKPKPQLKTAAAIWQDGGSEFNKCAACGADVTSKDHTICAHCKNTFCSECTNKSLDKCPKCKFEGYRKPQLEVEI